MPSARLLLLSCVACLSLAACSWFGTTGGGGMRGAIGATFENVTAPTICKRYTKPEERRDCRNKWTIAQKQCGKEQIKASENRHAEPRFRLAKCIGEKVESLLAKRTTR